MLRAGCHKDCLKEDVERCVVDWSDGSCGGNPKGVWSPSKERDSRQQENDTEDDDK